MKKIKTSAGIILFRTGNDINNDLQVLLVHPGGPFWAKKDLGVWSIPKGEIAGGENMLDAARRELKEETGIEVDGSFIALSPVKLKSGKIIYAWAIKYDFEIINITSNTFEMEWPPKSGKVKDFPEIDKADWFRMEDRRSGAADQDGVREQRLHP